MYPPDRRGFLKLAAAAAAAVPLAPVGLAHARAGALDGRLVKLKTVLHDAQYPEQTGDQYNGPNLKEASGIVASRRYPGVFWIIRDGSANDDPVRRGYRNAVYAIRFDPDSGTLLKWAEGVPQTSCDRFLKHVYLKHPDGTVVKNNDIEDIALEMGTSSGPFWLWLGNIGNNPHAAKPGELFRIPEPDPSTATEVTVDLNYRYWTHADHEKGQANVESLFVCEGVPHIVVKTAPSGVGLQQGHIIKLPRTNPGGEVDGIKLGALHPPDGTGFKPTGADLRDGRLLISRAVGWARYDADPTLRGDALIKALCENPPVSTGFWESDHSLAANEAVAWLHPNASASFLAVAETAVFRWWTGS